MADKRSFWADLSRKTGTWAGVTALALAVGEQVEEWLDSTAQASVGAHHAWAVLAVAVLRAVIALVCRATQGMETRLHLQSQSRFISR